MIEAEAKQRITGERLASITMAGLENELQYGAKVLEYVETLATSLLESPLSSEQVCGIRRTKNDTRAVLSEIARLIDTSVGDEEDKANRLYIVVRMMDNLLSLGALDTAVQGDRFSRINGKAGGSLRGKALAEEAEKQWKAETRPIIIEIRERLPKLSQDKTVCKLQDHPKLQHLNLPGAKSPFENGVAAVFVA